MNEDDLLNELLGKKQESTPPKADTKSAKKSVEQPNVNQEIWQLSNKIDNLNFHKKELEKKLKQSEEYNERIREDNEYLNKDNGKLRSSIKSQLIILVILIGVIGMGLIYVYNSEKDYRAEIKSLKYESILLSNEVKFFRKFHKQSAKDYAEKYEHIVFPEEIKKEESDANFEKELLEFPSTHAGDILIGVLVFGVILIGIKATWGDYWG